MFVRKATNFKNSGVAKVSGCFSKRFVNARAREWLQTTLHSMELNVTLPFSLKTFSKHRNLVEASFDHNKC